MKIILTGSTGLIGQFILSECIKNPYIDHVYSITRKPLPDHISNQAKVSVIVLADFESWSASQLHTLRDAGVAGCIWCLGGAVARFKNTDDAAAANITLPITAAEAFLRDLAGGPKQPFRFVYMSVASAEQDQFRSLWTRAQTRKIKGTAERGLLEIADRGEARAKFEVYCLRLGRVLEGGQTMGNVLTEAVSSSVTLERVAKKSMEIVLYGSRDRLGRTKKIIENGEVLGEDWAEVNSMAM